MITNRFLTCCLLSLAAVVLLPSLGAAPAPTSPGNYRDWKGDIDEVSILQTFRADDYRDILVESFESKGVELPDKTDNTYKAVSSALESIKPAFMEGLQKKLRAKTPLAAEGRKPAGNALLIRVRLTKVDPGSQAARYFGGFGAGAVKIAMVGEVIDAHSHRTLVKFTQERRSAFGAFGGGYGELFARTARQIGGDVATLINAF